MTTAATIDWDWCEPGRYNSMCGNFVLIQDQLYTDIFHLRHAESDEYIDDGFFDDMAAAAAKMDLPARLPQ
jgi:hypothetical protein